MNDLWRKILSLFGRRRLERELDEEIQSHLALEAQERIADGQAEKEAWAGARRDFGNITLVKEVTRAMWGWGFVETLARDLRYSLRTMKRSPGFTTVAVLSLALGIGANTAIFSLLDAVLLKMLPVERPEELIELLTLHRGGSIAFSYQALQHFRHHNQVLAGLIAGSTKSPFYTTFEGGSPERVDGQYVTGDYFEVLGVRAILGRPLALEDDRIGAGNAVAVISYGLWQRRFGGDSSAVGKTLIIEDVPVTVVGIAPPEFFGVQTGARTDLWIPLALEPRLRQPSLTSSAGYKWLQLMGRLKPGLSMEQAQADLNVLFRRAVVEEEVALQAEPAAREWARSWLLALEPASNGLSQLRRQFSRPLWVLMLVVGIVLLIACANVANLLFARARAREKEIAVRLSLGAGRSRLMLQLLTESLALASLGGAFGLLIASWAGPYLMTFLASGRIPVLLDIRPDARVLAFTAGIAVFTGILFGLIPAFRATDLDFASVLKGAGGGSHPGSGGPLSKGLVVAQMALLVVLVLGAGLFLRSLYNLKSIDLGFDHDKVLLVVLDPSRSGYAPERLHVLYTELLDRIEAIPGVKSASLSWITPIVGGGSMRTVWLEGDASRRAPDTYLNWVAPKYFATLATPLIAGRDFGPQDRGSGARAAIVNQTFARRYFGVANPIGKRVNLGDGDTGEIVGVVGDAKYLELSEATPPTLYLNTFQEKSPASQFVIRAAREPGKLAGPVRQEVQALAANIAVTEMKTLTQQVDASIVQERLLATLAAFFGALALLLAAVGLYGVIGYGVARRAREIGIRIALGAAPAAVVRMVLRETMVLAAAGLGLGLPVALILSRSVASLLYGLTPTDPLVISVSLVTLFVVAVAAGFLPARRACRIDPMEALRCE